MPPIPQDPGSRETLLRRIVETVNRLPVRLRRVFILSHYRGWGIDEIARKTGISRREARVALQQANCRFRKTIDNGLQAH